MQRGGRNALDREVVTLAGAGSGARLLRVQVVAMHPGRLGERLVACGERRERQGVVGPAC